MAENRINILVDDIVMRETAEKLKNQYDWKDLDSSTTPGKAEIFRRFLYVFSEHDIPLTYAERRVIHNKKNRRKKFLADKIEERKIVINNLSQQIPQQEEIVKKIQQDLLLDKSDAQQKTYADAKKKLKLLKKKFEYSKEQLEENKKEIATIVLNDPLFKDILVDEEYVKTLNTAGGEIPDYSKEHMHNISSSVENVYDPDPVQRSTHDNTTMDNSMNNSDEANNANEANNNRADTVSHDPAMAPQPEQHLNVSRNDNDNNSFNHDNSFKFDKLHDNEQHGGIRRPPHNNNTHNEIHTKEDQEEEENNDNDISGEDILKQLMGEF